MQFARAGCVVTSDHLTTRVRSARAIFFPYTFSALPMEKGEGEIGKCCRNLDAISSLGRACGFVTYLWKRGSVVTKVHG